MTDEAGPVPDIGSLSAACKEKTSLLVEALKLGAPVALLHWRSKAGRSYHFLALVAKDGTGVPIAIIPEESVLDFLNTHDAGLDKIGFAADPEFQGVVN